MACCLNCNFRSFWTTEDNKACLLCIAKNDNEFFLHKVFGEKKVENIGCVWFRECPEDVPHTLFEKQILFDMPLYFWTDTIGRKWQRIKV